MHGKTLWLLPQKMAQDFSPNPLNNEAHDMAWHFAPGRQQGERPPGMLQPEINPQGTSEDQEPYAVAGWYFR